MFNLENKSGGGERLKVAKENLVMRIEIELGYLGISVTKDEVLSMVPGDLDLHQLRELSAEIMNMNKENINKDNIVPTATKNLKDFPE